jgi:hypothetical protein
MGHPRRRGWIVVALVGVLTIMAGLVIGPTVARAVVHRPDSGAFHSYISTYLGVADLHRLHLSPGSADIEAQRACTWLDTQPVPTLSVDPSGRFALDSLLKRYLATSGHPAVTLSKPGRSMVVAGAWNDLCWNSMKAHVAPRLAHQD